MTSPCDIRVYAIGATAVRWAVPTVFCRQRTQNVAAKSFDETDLCRFLWKKYLTPSRFPHGLKPILRDSIRDRDK